MQSRRWDLAEWAGSRDFQGSPETKITTGRQFDVFENYELTGTACRSTPDSGRYAVLHIWGQSRANGFPLTYDLAHIRDPIYVQHPHHHRHGHTAHLTLHRKESNSLKRQKKAPHTSPTGLCLYHHRVAWWLRRCTYHRLLNRNIQRPHQSLDCTV